MLDKKFVDEYKKIKDYNKIKTILKLNLKIGKNNKNFHIKLLKKSLIKIMPKLKKTFFSWKVDP